MEQFIYDLVRVHKAGGNITDIKPHNAVEQAVKDVLLRIDRLETQITGLTAGSSFPQVPVE